MVQRGGFIRGAIGSVGDMFIRELVKAVVTRHNSFTPLCRGHFSTLRLLMPEWS
jgi:hypothetical protein